MPKRKIIFIGNSQSDYEIREAQLEGVTHYVVPVVMMVEGVHNGSRGPLLYTSANLAQNVASWNGVPIVVNHPEDEDGSYISANNPDVMNSELVGRVYNVSFTDGKLRGEAWINKERIGVKSDKTLEIIQNQWALDVSVGVFSDELQESGQWNGEDYRAVATNFRPDHLALLPDSVGACSWDDGCGIRNNENSNIKKGGIMPKEQSGSKDKYLANSTAVVIDIANADNYMDTVNKLYEVVNSMDSEMNYNYLEAVYENSFIYRRVVRNTRGGANSRYFQQSYSLDNSGAIALNGDPTEVRKDVAYAAVTNNSSSLKRTKFNTNSKQKQMSKCTKIASIISNKANQFTEDDREFLNGLEEEQLDKFVAVAGETDEGKTKSPTANSSQTLTKEDLTSAVKEVLATYKDPDKYLNELLPTEVAKSLKSGMAIVANQKKTLIDQIVANSTFKKEKLEKYELEDLQEIYENVVGDTTEVNFIGNANVFESTSKEEAEDEITAMTGFKKPETQQA